MSGSEEQKRADALDTSWSIKRATCVFQRELIGVHDATVQAKTLKEFIKEEEYDAIAIIHDLDSGINGCEMVDAIAETLGWTNEKQLKNIFDALNILFKVKSELPNIMKLDWNVSFEQKNETRKYMALQCPKLIKDGENEPMIFVMTVGRNNEINDLLCLMYDVFSKYRMDDRIKRSNSNQIGKRLSKTSADFVKETILRQLDENVKKKIEVAMKSYEHRLIPGFKLQPPKIYEDKCEIFIEYTIMVSKAIQNISSSVDMMMCIPFQVDLVIIPCNIVQMNIEFHDIDDSDDDDDDDDVSHNINKGISDDYKNDEIDEEFCGPIGLRNTFNAVLKIKFNIPYVCTQINHLDGDACRTLTDMIKQYMKGKMCPRVSVVIDRRTEPNTLYVYALPKNKSTFREDFCLTTLIHMCGKFVFPIWNPLIEKSNDFAFIGGRDSRGEYFQISFQVLSDDQTRMQWNFCGHGTRLDPEMMISVWPTVFINDKLPKRYTKEFIENEVKARDIVFDDWCTQFK